MSKSIESECLGQLVDWESVLLKNLLKQFILLTNPGLPHLCDGEETEPQAGIS